MTLIQRAMKCRIGSVLFISSVMDIVLTGGTLQCWKCVAHDCEKDPEDNYKASKVNCNKGDRCMKVRYRMFDNVTHYDSVIRTCTNNPCDTSSIEDFVKCVATPKQYMIGGCTLRSCCDDKDLCNSGEVVGRSFPVMCLTSGIVTFMIIR